MIAVEPLAGCSWNVVDTLQKFRFRTLHVRQSRLIMERRGQMDLVRRHLRAGRYAEARAAAREAAYLLQDSKSRTLALVVQIAPWFVRRCLILCDAQVEQQT